jgi:hypothetical protein
MRPGAGAGPVNGPARAGGLWLEWERGGVQSRLVLDRPLVIGRDRSSHVCLPEPTVSRRHAVVSLVDGQPFVDASGSTNGLKLDSGRADRTALNLGQPFTIGSTVFRVVGGPLAAQARPRQAVPQRPGASVPTVWPPLAQPPVPPYPYPPRSPAGGFAGPWGRTGGQARGPLAVAVALGLVAVLVAGSLVGLAVLRGGSNESPASSSQGTLAADTVWLQQNSSTHVVSQNSDSITIAGSDGEIQPGKVILSTEGQGAIRKVVSVKQDGGNTVAQTTPAQLTDAFDELHADVKPGFNKDVIGDIKSTTPGLTFKWVQSSGASTGSRPGRYEDAGVQTNMLEMDFGNMTLSKSQGISLDGSLDFQGDPELDIDIGRGSNGLPTISKLSAGYQCQIHGSLTIASTYGGDLGAKQTWFDAYVGEPIVAGWLVFLPRLTIKSAMTGTAAGGLSHKQDLNVTASAAETYQAGTGWSFTKNFTPTLTASDSNVDGPFGLTLTPLTVTLSYQLYGIVGPYASLSANISATGTHTVQSSVEGIDAVVEGGIGGEVGFVAQTPAGLSDLFGASWKPLDVTLDLVKVELFHQFFPFQGTSSIVVGDNGPAADDVFSVTLDGTSLGQTDKGGTGRFHVGALTPGHHTLTIGCLDDGAGGADVCTLGIDLSNGFTFDDGSVHLSDELSLNQVVDYTIVVPPPT